VEPCTAGGGHAGQRGWDSSSSRQHASVVKVAVGLHCLCRHGGDGGQVRCLRFTHHDAPEAGPAGADCSQEPRTFELFLDFGVASSAIRRSLHIAAGARLVSAAGCDAGTPSMVWGQCGARCGTSQHAPGRVYDCHAARGGIMLGGCNQARLPAMAIRQCNTHVTTQAIGRSNHVPCRLQS
jgi:hypothetical protein